ncbi:MAG: 50S ribosomal protein L21 [Candidatus Shapirobacteria bacterium]|nr:50S ribosomal protein L21 [Candidatus Shapirobacteria bacterium]
MKYAVIAISGSQFKVEENQKLTVDNLNLKEGDKSILDQILLTADGDKIKVGTPIVKNAKVEFEIVKNYQGKKLKVFKYKSKSRYRKTMGFRSQLTEIKITKITL